MSGGLKVDIDRVETIPLGPPQDSVSGLMEIALRGLEARIKRLEDKINVLEKALG